MSERVQVGIIGTSGWTQLMFLPSLKSHPGARIAAICGRNGERAEALAQEHGIGRSFTDYRELLRSDIDAVVIAVPDDLHKEMTLAAVDAGLDILCEKPMAPSLGDAVEMHAAAEAAGVRHLLNFTWHWQPQFQHLKTMIDEGFVGRPLRARFEFAVGSGPNPKYQWRLDGSRATGMVGDLGSHMIHMAQWLLGPISSVLADAPVMIRRDIATPANDTAHMIFQFASGAQGSIDVTTLVHQDCACEITARIDGEEGSVEVRLIVMGPRSGPRIVAKKLDGPTETIVVPGAGDDFLSHFLERSVGARHFIDAIQGGYRPDPGFDKGVEVQKVIDASLRSHRERRWVPIG